MSYLSAYDLIVFDCDGVILDSNKVKTEAFYNAVRSYGDNNAKALVDYHLKNGGVSRYAKFEYFLTNILKAEPSKEEMRCLLNSFSSEVKRGLMSCNVADGLGTLRAKSPHAKWLIVSGGDQTELREIFAERGLDHFFDGGIFGSPDTKDCILRRIISSQTLIRNGLFIGDSKYDYEAATRAGMDFIFVKGWSEFSDAEIFFEGKRLSIVNSLADLCL